jgi:ParB family transcriptional regulator, chromosome partitioning protein
MAQHKALGRGLDALLKPAAPAGAPAGAESDGGAAKIPVDKIRANRSQPRRHFAEEALKELAESIKVHGLAQPLLVSRSAVPGEYELVAGERRLRAAKLAGLAEVPCVIRAVTDRERHELSLIENLQRQDLNAVEEAESIRKLMTEHSLTQEEVARALGRSRPAVANKLRLLELPEDVRRAVIEGRLSEGHARAILGVEDAARRSELGRRVVSGHMTVREVETLVADWASARREGRVKLAKKKDADVRHLEEDLQKSLGRRVELQAKGKSKGWLRLEFYSLDDLDRLIKALKKTAHGK